MSVRVFELLLSQPEFPAKGVEAGKSYVRRERLLILGLIRRQVGVHRTNATPVLH